MRLFISFLLSLFIYSLLIGLFIYFIISTNKQQQVKQVYIHQAIVKSVKKQTIAKIKKPVKKEIKKEIKKPAKKEPIKKTEDTISKGGQNIKTEDLFNEISDNIPTEKIVHKKQKNMTKKKGNSDFSKLAKKTLSNLESNLQSSAVIVSNSDKKSSDYISNEFGKIWSQIDTQDGNFVTLAVDVVNGQLNVVVIATNLDTILLNQFLKKLKLIDTSKIKNFDGKITFNTKLKEMK